MSLTQVPWQVLIVIGAVLTTLSVTLNKYQAHRGSALQTQASKYLGSFSWMLAWWMVMSRQVPEDWWIYSFYGMFVTLILIVYTKAQRISMTQTSLVEPIGQVLGVMLAAVMIGEWQVFTGTGGAKLIVALLLMPLLIWLFYEHRSVNSKKWLKLVVFFLLSLAVAKVMVKFFLGSAQAVEVLVFQYLGSLLAGVAGVFIKKQQSFLTKKFVMRGMLQGMIGSSGILMLYTAIKMTTVSETTLLRTPLILILKTLSGLILFKEASKMTRNKWIGVGVALIITFLVITANH